MTAPVLQLQDLAVGHGGRPVLQHLALSLQPGRWMALVGANASGKSTLLQTIAGRLPPIAGRIVIEGTGLAASGAGNVSLPGYALPADELPAFLILRQAIDIFIEAHGLASMPAEVEALARGFGLDAHRDTLIRHASLGTRQKLSVVLALARSPRLLLLDEVFNGLDHASAAVLRRWLRRHVEQQQLSIVLATHGLDVVLQCCDEVALVDPGIEGLRRWEVEPFRGADAIEALQEALAGASRAPAGG